VNNNKKTTHRVTAISAKHTLMAESAYQSVSVKTVESKMKNLHHTHVHHI